MTVRPFVALSAVILVGVIVGCGGDDDSTPDPATEPAVGSTAEPTAEATSTAVVSADPGLEPRLSAPVSRFAISQTDLGQGYLTDVQGTFQLTAEDYAGTTLFESTADGLATLAQWGYQEGYETGYEPEGRTQAVLNGSYYMKLEVHLFDSAEGAQAAYDYFVERLRTTSSNVTAATVGNQSSAWRRESGLVPGSSVEGTLHFVVTRRGNLLSVVQTWGADPFMKVDAALGWARLTDAKAVGNVETTEPTPSGNVSSNQ